MRGDRGTVGALPIRRANGAILVELPRRARRLLLNAASAVQRCAEDPASPAFGQLYSQLDEAADVDDPLFRLERQTAIDDLCTVVVETANEARISDIQAEAWLRVLGMAVLLVAANAGIRTEDDLDRLDRRRTYVLDVLRSLQLLLACSLDPALGEVDEWGSGPD